MVTEYQELLCRRGSKQFAGLEDGVFPEGNYKWLTGTYMFHFRKKMGTTSIRITTIAQPRAIHLRNLLAELKHAQKKFDIPLSINLKMYEDGSVSPESRALLRKVRQGIRGKLDL